MKKLRGWAEALILLQLLAIAGSYRNGTLASHMGNVPYMAAFFSFGIIGMILLIISFIKR